MPKRNHSKCNHSKSGLPVAPAADSAPSLAGKLAKAPSSKKSSGKKAAAQAKPKDRAKGGTRRTGPETAPPRGKAAKAKGAAGGPAKEGPSQKAAPLARRKTFLVAVRLPQADAPALLRVYAAVKRSAADALMAVQDELGAEAAVELTGSLSTRMARTLGLKAEEVRLI
ncbi:hypothetical protein MMB17_20580 [Methylobacterium organophilum]|uniref:hypothetical protein n=1 Tax=Methylobacterium organophilum TaxID=410 RepID=UPI001F14729F|nr:hypothetical protein [Methylobacterium organophilum]UMY17016.1 hypothetical protein MMB17_20580 [Methylobacterium organophilum]